MSNRIRPLRAAVVTATAGLALALPAAISHADSSTLAPPVMHETFTPLPCSGKAGHRTTLQDEGCSEHQILRSDKKIDSLNKTIFNGLPDDPSRRDFVTGHKAWLRYRKAYCASVSDVFRGGTEAGVLDADCTASVNSQHVKELRTFAHDLAG